MYSLCTRLKYTLVTAQKARFHKALYCSDFTPPLMHYKQMSPSEWHTFSWATTEECTPSNNRLHLTVSAHRDPTHLSSIDFLFAFARNKRTLLFYVFPPSYSRFLPPLPVWLVTPFKALLLLSHASLVVSYVIVIVISVRVMGRLPVFVSSHTGE